MKAAKPKPLLAYAVQEEDEGTGGIVFARSGIAARRDGANEHAGGDFLAVTCRRAPWADQYAPGPVPLTALVDHGWWHECGGCGCTIRDGHEDEHRTRFDPVQVGQSLFCTPRCRRQYLVNRTSRKIKEMREIARMRAALWKVAPGVTLLGGDRCFIAPNGKPGQCSINFAFPGIRHDRGRFAYDKPGEAPTFWIPGGDVAAWEAWRASARSKQETIQ